VGRPQTRWEDYIEDLGWNCLELQPSDLLEVASGQAIECCLALLRTTSEQISDF